VGRANVEGTQKVLTIKGQDGGFRDYYALAGKRKPCGKESSETLRIACKTTGGKGDKRRLELKADGPPGPTVAAAKCGGERTKGGPVSKGKPSQRKSKSKAFKELSSTRLSHAVGAEKNQAHMAIE